MRSGIHFSLFETLFRTQFLPLKHVLMVSWPGIWQGSATIFGLSWFVTSLRDGKERTGILVMFKSRLHWIMVLHLKQGNLTLTLNLRVEGMAGNHLAVDLRVQQILRRKEAIGWHSLYVGLYCFITIIFIHCACWYTFNYFWTNGKVGLLIGLHLIWLKVPIFSLGVVPYYFIALNILTLKLL